jgi:hypothetical protein
MGGTSEELRRLWRENREKRRAVLRMKVKDLTPQLLQSLPWYLKQPEKPRGFKRPSGLRGPELVKYLMLLGGVFQDRRFDDCINALLEHELIEPSTHKFPKQAPEIRNQKQHFENECMAEVRALIEQGMHERPACRKIAAKWGLGNSLEAGEQQLRDQLKKSKSLKT